ncbi:hypothetical protein M0R45_035462 [Rubus argutus]|uniref:Tyrosine specific protein phosphatases domain-containing protein n=1 Tax=Rubus argutus TaxID=59490 RepID=A0AAW1VVR4_RUBAR
MNYYLHTSRSNCGSCLQTPKDVDKLRSNRSQTIFCLQQNSDLEYFGVDIGAIQEYAKEFDDIEHLRAEIRDFDAYDLRLQLPAVVSKLYKAINRNGGVTYIHCTAGLGRAPATAVLAYMFWVQGYNLKMHLNYCWHDKKPVTLTWSGGNCSTVEISGLDIGWGQRIPLKFDGKQGSWILKRELPEGRYEYKYIIDGEWTYNNYELVTSPNEDGHVNNYVQVVEDDPNSTNANIRKRLTGDDPDLTTHERLKIRQFLEAHPSDE